MRLHLNRERALRGSLTVGPEGPLVRFDRSFPPSLLFCPTGAGLRRSPATDGGSSRASAGGDGTARPRRSFGWLKGRRRWKESPAASSSAGEGYGGEVTIVLRWSPIEFGQLGSSARLRGSFWWCWLGERVAGCDESHRGLAAAELAGVEEDGHYGSIYCVGSSTGSV